MLRSAPGHLFRATETVLLRADAPMDSAGPGETGRPIGDRLAELTAQLEALGLRVHAGVLHQPVGAASWIEGIVPDEADLLARARSIELEALLQWGNGVWTPTTYHYQLPSGEHAGGFVRVADAIQRPRDAEVLASWLHAELADNIGIVADTGTLSALVQALVAALRGRGWRPGAVNVLDGYPNTSFDVAEAVRDADRGAGLIGLLSVNSSGRVRDRLISALAGQPGTGRRTLDVLVDKNRLERHERETSEGILVRTWHPRPGDDPLVAGEGASAERCERCARAATATLVPVNPRSFDGQLQAGVTRVTPSVSDARANQKLWELCNSGAIEYEADPVEPLLPHRPRGPMAIKVDHTLLLARPEFRDAAHRAFARRVKDDRLRYQQANLLLVPDHEYAYDGMDALIEELRPLLGVEAELRTFPGHGDWEDALKNAVREAPEAIAVLTLGTVTGGILQAALSAIQGARDPGAYELTAWVVHARPEDRRGWQTLRNSYAGRLVSAWHSYLPSHSPFADERAVLESLSQRQVDGLSEPARNFLRLRRGSVEHLAPGGQGLLWGTTTESELTPNSIFGQGLRGPAVLAAAGAAMERARHEARDAAVPARRVFEVSAIVRSYYDPMILAAVLRWLAPHEAWWGWEPRDEPEIVAAMLERATEEQRAILVPELLLAAAQGKLHTLGAGRVLAYAGRLRESDTLTDLQRGALEIGIALVGDPGTVDEQRNRADGASDRIAGCTTAANLLSEVPGLLRDLQQGRLSPDLVARLDDRVSELLAGVPPAGPHPASEPTLGDAPLEEPTA
jgi:hypothetical protein